LYFCFVAVAVAVAVGRGNLITFLIRLFAAVSIADYDFEMILFMILI